MDQLLRGLESNVAAYLDDIVIFSNSWEEHRDHIRTVLNWLKEAGLTLKPHKCHFAMAECVYLGHVVGNGVVHPEVTKLNKEDINQLGKLVRINTGISTQILST